MTHTRFNHLAIWILIVIDQAIGFAWYALWGEKWLNLHAKTMTDIERTHDYQAYVVAVIAAIVLNYALAWLISRLGHQSAIAGLRTALICFFAFLFVEHLTIAEFSAFETNPWPLVLIDMGRSFVVFAVSGLVLGGWRARVPHG